MSDDAPQKPHKLGRVWPIAILMLFFGMASIMWSKSQFMAISLGVAGMAAFSYTSRFRTWMIQEELSFGELLVNYWAKRP